MLHREAKLFKLNEMIWKYAPHPALREKTKQTKKMQRKWINISQKGRWKRNWNLPPWSLFSYTDMIKVFFLIYSFLLFGTLGWDEGDIDQLNQVATYKCEGVEKIKIRKGARNKVPINGQIPAICILFCSAEFLRNNRWERVF